MIEMFDVLAHDDQPRNEKDRFFCYGCGVMVAMQDRQWLSESAGAYLPRKYGVCATCAQLPLTEMLWRASERKRARVEARKAYKLEGSFQNRQLEHVVGMPEPEVGMGATMIMHTDRRAYTIIEVKSPSVIVVQCDTPIRTDSYGMSEVQSYRFEMNPQSQDIRIVRRNRYGEWKQQGGGWSFLVGKRLEHHDYSF